MIDAPQGETSQRHATEQNVLSYDGVEKIYGDGDDAVTAIDGIDFDVGAGEFVSLVGPSGCGKSTLLHLATGLIEPTQGDVKINGTNVQSPDHAKHNVGLIFQSPVLLKWRTIRKNVLLPIEIMSQNGVLNEDMDFYRQHADDLIEMVGLGNFKDSYPNELSGGMQQRASICRSLVYGPPLLLMDEPFGALDAMTRNKMNEEILRIWQETQKSILFVTHNLEEAVFLSDRIVVLSNRPGRVLDVIEVNLDRPRTERTRTDSEFQQIVGETYEYFRDHD